MIRIQHHLPGPARTGGRSDWGARTADFAADMIPSFPFCISGSAVTMPVRPSGMLSRPLFGFVNPSFRLLTGSSARNDQFSFTKVKALGRHLVLCRLFHFQFNRLS